MRTVKIGKQNGISAAKHNQTGFRKKLTESGYYFGVRIL